MTTTPKLPAGLGTDLALIRTSLPADNTAALEALGRVEDVLRQIARAMIADIILEALRQVIPDGIDPADIPTEGPMQ